MTSTHAAPDIPAAPPHSDHRMGPLWAGVALMALGVVALTFPFLTSLGAALIVGALLAASGVVMLAQSFACRPWWRLALHVLWGLASIAAGAWMIIAPLSGALTLSIVLAAMFLTTGATRVALALKAPRPRNWGWALVSGLISLAFAGFVIWMLPVAALWLPGIVVGVDLIFAGAALIAVRDALEAAARTPPPS